MSLESIREESPTEHRERAVRLRQIAALNINQAATEHLADLLDVLADVVDERNRLLFRERMFEQIVAGAIGRNAALDWQAQLTNIVLERDGLVTTLRRVQDAMDWHKHENPST